MGKSKLYRKWHEQISTELQGAGVRVEDISDLIESIIGIRESARLSGYMKGVSEGIKVGMSVGEAKGGDDG